MTVTVTIHTDGGVVAESGSDTFGIYAPEVGRPEALVAYYAALPERPEVHVRDMRDGGRWAPAAAWLARRDPTFALVGIGA